MFERIFAGLYRLYPAQFREVYGEETQLLLREQFRDARGWLPTLRLCFDLILDVTVGLLQAYWITAKIPTSTSVRQSPGGMPHLHLLAGGKTHPGPFLVGGLLTLSALCLFSFALGHEPPFRSHSGSNEPVSPIEAVMERVNKPLLAGLAEDGQSESGKSGAEAKTPQARIGLLSRLPMSVADTHTSQRGRGSYELNMAGGGGSVAERNNRGSNSNPPTGPEKPGDAWAAAVFSGLGLKQSAPSRDDAGKVPTWQKTAGDRLEFEVASIRPSKAGEFMRPSFALDESDVYVPADPHGLFTADFPLPVYIGFAYNIRPSADQTHAMFVKLPKWVMDENFVIHARAPQDTTKAQMRLMLQSLLADRFGLRVHFETREVSAFALVLKKPGKLGSKLRPHADGPACPVSVKRPVHGWAAGAAKVANSANGEFPPFCGGAMLIPGPDHTALLGSRNATMKEIADTLAGVSRLDRPWVDETGLMGRYDFSIDFIRQSNSPLAPGAEAPVEPEGPSFLEALQEQLGLKLKSAKSPVETLVIDHIQQPTPN